MNPQKCCIRGLESWELKGTESSAAWFGHSQPLLPLLQPWAGRLPPAAKKPLLLLTALISIWSWAGGCEGRGLEAPAGWNSTVGLCTVCSPQQVLAGEALAPSSSAQQRHALWRSLLPHQHVEFHLRCHHRVSWLLCPLTKPCGNEWLHWTSSKVILYSGRPLKSQVLYPWPSRRQRQCWFLHGMWIAVNSLEIVLLGILWLCSQLPPREISSVWNDDSVFLSWNSAEPPSWLSKCVGILQCGLSCRGRSKQEESWLGFNLISPALHMLKRESTQEKADADRRLNSVLTKG